MIIYLPDLRSLKNLGSAGLAAIMLLIATPTPYAAAQSIVFPHENISDLRGLLNVFHTFRQACLTQTISSELPAKIAPEGYRVFAHEEHLWGDHTGAKTDKTAVLSKTGSEQGDWDGGHIIVEYFMPSDKNPDGRCTVKWKRGWDYEERQAHIALGLYGVLDAQISFHLEAVLNSRPDDQLIWKQKSYAGVSDWYTFCLDDTLCKFKVIYDFDPDTGIDISISRGAVQN